MNFFGFTVPVPVSRGALVVALAIGSAGAVGACGSSDAGGPTTFPPGGDNGGDGAAPSYDGGSLSFHAGDASVVSLAFDPPTVTLTLDGKTPKMASFALKATLPDGTTQTVAANALQFDRPDLASMQIGSPVTLTAAGQSAGAGTLHGVYAGLEATAQLEVVVNYVDVGVGVDPGSITKLNGGGLAPDPKLTSLQYPYDRTLFPLGLASPLLMWAAPNASDVYRVHLEEKDYTFDGYYAVPQPAQKAIDQAVWDRVTASNQGDALKLAVSRLDVASGVAYASAKQSWSIAPASLRGAIYYWTTSAGGHMSRIRPGQGAQPEVLNGGKCMGCHAVSADGTTLVAVVEDQKSTDTGSRAWVTFGLPAAAPTVASTWFGGNVAVNPNGKFVVYGDRTMKLGDAKTGQPIANSGLEALPLDTNMLGFMTPAFSPDGKKLAMVEGGQGPNASTAWYHNLMEGKLVVVDFDEATQKVSNLKPLAPASAFPAAEHAIAYPSFTPDSKSVAFHVGDYTTGCDNQGCDANAKRAGSLWLQSIAGQAPVRLSTLTDSSATASDRDLSFEPTFNPVERGGYFWVVFTSSRDWGNKITGTANNGKKRLWVAAIDKTWTGLGDPSHPAFFLEGQEEDTTNMRGFWSLAQCTATPAPGAGGGACKAGFECCSGFCDTGTCVDKGTLACQGVSGACVTNDDCCNSSVVRCVAGACTASTPK